MNVEHFTRIRCACGTTVEVESYACCTLGPGYMGSCKSEIEFHDPEGWIGGYAPGVPYICPECVKEKYA